jgi:putative Holliday junction resolvase
MKIIGIDYGRKKIGLAIADGPLAEPLKVVRFESEEEALRKVEEAIKVEKVEKVVIGISEGKMAEETKEFGEKLKEELKIPVVYQDETLTTNEAQELSIRAGIKRKKRRALEDAYSAALILQSYVDSRRV